MIDDPGGDLANWLIHILEKLMNRLGINSLFGQILFVVVGFVIIAFAIAFLIATL